MNRFLMLQMTRLDARAKDLEARGDHRQAMETREKLCELTRSQLGARHPWLCTRLLDLAASYRQNGELAKAEATYRDVLDHLEGHPAPREPNLAQVLNTIGVFNCEIDQPRQAIVLFQRALDLSKNLPRRNRQLATLHNNLASSYHSLGHLTDAKQHYLAARQILDHHPLTPEKAYCLCDLAELLTEEEDEVAIDYIDEALSIFRHLYASDSSQLAEAKVRLADLYCRMAETRRAMSLLEEAVSVLERSDHHETEFAQCLDLLSRLQKGMDLDLSSS